MSLMDLAASHLIEDSEMKDAEREQKAGTTAAKNGSSLLDKEDDVKVNGGGDSSDKYMQELLQNDKFSQLQKLFETKCEPEITKERGNMLTLLESINKDLEESKGKIKKH